jgi:hypothetical protein
VAVSSGSRLGNTYRDRAVVPFRRRSTVARYREYHELPFAELPELVYVGSTRSLVARRERRPFLELPIRVHS